MPEPIDQYECDHDPGTTSAERCAVCGVQHGETPRPPAPEAGITPAVLDAPGQLLLDGMSHPPPEYVIARPAPLVARMGPLRGARVCDYCARGYRERLVPEIARLTWEHHIVMERRYQEWERDMRVGVVVVDGEVRDYRK